MARVSLNAELVIFLFTIVGAADFNSSASPPPSSTVIPLFDVDICVATSVVLIILEVALLALAAWIFAIILLSGAHKKNSFVYHVLNVAIADILLGASGILISFDSIIAPNVLCGLGSPAFSLDLFDLAEGIYAPATTQHYLSMAVIAGERIYSVMWPFRAQGRGPPVGITVALSIFYALNLAVTTTGYITGVSATGVFSGWGNLYFVVSLGNQYVSLFLIVATVILYVALVIAVSRRASHQIGVQPSTTVTDATLKRQAQITKTVFQVAAVYIATAFTFTVVETVITVLGGNGLISLASFAVVDGLLFIPLEIGQFCDLLIFEIKIEEIAKPSMKYLKKLWSVVKRSQGDVVAVGGSQVGFASTHHIASINNGTAAGSGRIIGQMPAVENAENHGVQP